MKHVGASVKEYCTLFRAAVFTPLFVPIAAPLVLTFCDKSRLPCVQRSLEEGWDTKCSGFFKMTNLARFGPFSMTTLCFVLLRKPLKSSHGDNVSPEKQTIEPKCLQRLGMALSSAGSWLLQNMAGKTWHSIKQRTVHARPSRKEGLEKETFCIFKQKKIL